ncbi:Very-long-chain enoyl-CoA reductase, partial [Geodia barretti]
KNPITHAQRAGHTTRKLWRGVCVYGVQCCRGGAEENEVGWSTVFLAEYAGPLAVYLLFYPRPALVYGTSRAGTDIAVHVAMVCWTLHYAKRLLETLFVHRFSHATMPLRNLFKNCSYYWGFTAFVSYYINHPLYTPPGLGSVQLFAGLALFLVCEYGNFSIHIALRDLRPPGRTRACGKEGGMEERRGFS